METITSQKSIINQIIINILTYYKNKENDTIDGQYRYFAYRTSDDNLTGTEIKMINNQIILQSKLSDSDVYILLRIMLCIREKNYFLFDNPTFIQEVYDDNDLNIDINDIRNMMLNSETYVDRWIEYLNLLVVQNNIEDYLLDDYQKNFDNFGTHVDNLQVYTEVPSVIGTKRTIQNIYNINDILI